MLPWLSRLPANWATPRERPPGKAARRGGVLPWLCYTCPWPGHLVTVSVARRRKPLMPCNHRKGHRNGPLHCARLPGLSGRCRRGAIPARALSVSGCPGGPWIETWIETRKAEARQAAEAKARRVIPAAPLLPLPQSPPHTRPPQPVGGAPTPHFSPDFNICREAGPRRRTFRGAPTWFCRG